MASRIVQYFADKLKSMKEYPITLTKAVYDENGNRLDNKLFEIDDNITGLNSGLSDKVSGFSVDTYEAVTGLAYDHTNKKLGLKVGADTVIPFSSSFNLSEIQCVYETGLSASITPLKDGFIIGYSCGYNGNAEYYKGPASLSNVSNIVTVSNPSKVTGHSTPVFLLKGECTAGKTVTMSVNSNGGAWNGGSVLLVAIPK